MEHIPLPQDPLHRHPLIARIIPDEKYPPFDSCSFEEYPSRAEDLNPGLYGRLQDDLTARQAFTQRWLFFGLLHCVFERQERHYRQEDFIVDTQHADGHTISVLSTSKLRELASSLSKESAIKKNQRIDSMANAIAKSHAACQQLEFVKGFGEDLLLCLKLLGSFLHKLILHLASDTPPPVLKGIQWLPQKTVNEDTKYDCLRADNHPFIDVLERRMLDAGWCPNRITAISRHLELESKYFFSRMRGPEGNDHAQCTRAHCRVNQIDPKSYRAGHVPPCNDCTLLHVDAVEMGEILSMDSMQVLIDTTKRFDECNKIPIKSVELKEKHEAPYGYIATSHVWSHGLGNPRANAMPRCQLNKLWDIIADFRVGPSEPVLPIWIDTVCCPVETEAKKQVLRDMRLIYQAARRVLVLDHDLSRMNAEGKTAVEWMMRISASDWMGRLWTLQEGLLAGPQQLVFEFEDTKLNVGGLQRVVKDIIYGTDH